MKSQKENGRNIADVDTAYSRHPPRGQQMESPVHAKYEPACETV